MFFISYPFFTWVSLTYDLGSFKIPQKVELWPLQFFLCYLKFILQKVKYIQVVNFLFKKKNMIKVLKERGKSI
jgi:hypothetical protein